MQILTQEKVPDITAEYGQVFIYVLENDLGCIKIGRTTKPKQRFAQLSGSNCGGGRVRRIGLSDMTYLYTLERILHERFAAYRVSGTEWFRDVPFEAVCKQMQWLFGSESYRVCNDVRKEYTRRHGPQICLEESWEKTTARKSAFC